jgi:hypothetical protein
MQALLGFAAIGTFCIVAAIIEALSDIEPSVQRKLKRRQRPSRNRKYSQ